MNNATIILLCGAVTSLFISPWWFGLAYGVICALLSCLVIDGLWWLMRKITQ